MATGTIQETSSFYSDLTAGSHFSLNQSAHFSIGKINILLVRGQASANVAATETIITVGNNPPSASLSGTRADNAMSIFSGANVYQGQTIVRIDSNGKVYPLLAVSSGNYIIGTLIWIAD